MPLTATTTRRAWLALSASLLAGALPLSAPLLANTVAAPNDRPAPVTVTLDAAHPITRFEGFGTALVWFANVTGRYAPATRERLADLFYGKDGLRFVIGRYNIGGGDAADTPPYMRPGGAVEGFWKQPAGTTGKDWWNPADASMWNWSADAGQRWWLDAIRERVPADHRILEAFSNSPPWFMTVSGKVSGATNALDDNLRPGFEAPFADYLVRSMQELETRHRVRFRTLSPVNEPNTPYWFAGNRQEGAHWSPPAQERMLVATARALRERGSSAVVAAMDETNAQTFAMNWGAYAQPARDAIGQLNVHSYADTGQTAVRDIARLSGKRLWMSEVDLSAPNTVEDFDDVRSMLALGERVVLDLKRLEPSAWVLWQAVEDLSARDKEKGSNWGLIKMDMRAAPGAAPRVNVTSKYWAMASFSRYILPGDRLVRTDDQDSVAAISAAGDRVVMVHVNHAPMARALTLKLPGVATRGWTMRVVTTDATRHAQESAPVRLAGDEVATTAAPFAITTVVLSKTGRRTD